MVSNSCKTSYPFAHYVYEEMLQIMLHRLMQLIPRVCLNVKEAKVAVALSAFICDGKEPVHNNVHSRLSVLFALRYVMIAFEDGPNDIVLGGSEVAGLNCMLETLSSELGLDEDE